MVIGFIHEFDASGFGELFEGFDEVRVPPFTLFKKDAGYTVSYLERFTCALGFIDLLQDYAVCGKVAFSCSSPENVTVKPIVKVEVKQVLF